MDKLRWIWSYVNYFRTLLLYFLISSCKYKIEAKEDINVWVLKLIIPEKQNKNIIIKLGYCIKCEKAFINVLQNRLHKNPAMYCISRLLFRPLESLYINMPPENIGGGLYFQHGFSTVVAARKIGKNCVINQQVTIGYNGEYAPVIGDNVVVAAGAIVIGNVCVGNNSIIAAGAVVTKNVNEGETVAGVPARVIRTGDNDNL